MINGESLVSERPQAWDNGPVYVSLWRHVKDWGYQGLNCQLVMPLSGQLLEANLTQNEVDLIDHVWSRYGNYSAKQLSDMTHEPETPWTTAYVKWGRNTELHDDEIAEHYLKLGSGLITNR
ncbi:SocA family protein [Actibacterium sp. 188UL27-1]|nr:SocA family protein [Actibacterium sp. 188UL27-1]